ncbi:hypothetical protein ACFSQU_18090 [Massilia sp. GCM10020059]|uniref:Uncharacterized protein n=1 Tax=Massilia agrisoli TaxID=2892444 RepID=A0ABS8ITF3_9BURK|nr:hypothetical protein [Massilia agrisoli]MCC6071453.1 hypothetical protein [Massilia agrisoli]
MYTISEPSGTLRRDGVEVPQDDRTAEYASYVEWLREGNGPETISDEAPPMQRIDVSAWQIRKALNASGLRQQVEDAVASSDSQELKDGWHHSPRFYSDNELALQLGAGLGKTPEEMRELFRLAESL